jgi:hypothetical protein
MANTAIVASRRNDIARRWLRGESVSSIAESTGVPFGTVRHDLHFVRRALLAGQGEVLRACRAKTMAAVEDTISEAWRCVDALKAAPPAERDWPALNASLTLILRGHAQLAKVAGLGAPPDAPRLQHDVLWRDVWTWVKENDPEEIAHKASLARLMASYEDEEEDDDGSVSEAQLIEQVNAAYERGRAEGAKQANEVAMAAIREVAEQVRAETAQPEPEPFSAPAPPVRRAGFDPPDPIDDAEPEDFAPPPAPPPTAAERTAAFIAAHTRSGGIG